MTAEEFEEPLALSVRRWLVLGAGGAGKTTLALKLGRILRLPIIHLDRHFWQPGWVEPSDEAWDRNVAELSRGEAWVIDGNYSRTLGPRLERAQAAILLDPPTLQCVWGVVKRATWRRGRIRPDLAEECDEQFPSLEFLWYVSTYKWRSRPKVLRRVKAASHVTLYHFRSRSEGRAFLAGLRSDVEGRSRIPESRRPGR
jgi:adenylate kinase family enzyme